MIPELKKLYVTSLFYFENALKVSCTQDYVERINKPQQNKYTVLKYSYIFQYVSQCMLFIKKENRAKS